MTLKTPDKGDLRRIKKLYRTAFPRVERKPFRLVPRQIKKGDAELFALESDGEFAGFALIAKAEDIVLLSYFAVEERFRGRGIGSAALKALIERYSESRFILEIEDVNVPCDNPEAREKRRRFYLNNGMTSAGFTVRVFSTEMEILTSGKPVTFEEYRAFYSARLGMKTTVKNVNLTNDD